jgi:hypothetical protein
MPIVPGIRQQLAMQEDQRPTPEHILMTAADMRARGQLHEEPTLYSDPKAPLQLPSLGGGRGQRPPKGKRR